MLMGFAPEQLRTKGDVVLSPGAVGTSSLLPVLAGGVCSPACPSGMQKGRQGGSLLAPHPHPQVLFLAQELFFLIACLFPWLSISRCSFLSEIQQLGATRLWAGGGVLLAGDFVVAWGDRTVGTDASWWHGTGTRSLVLQEEG